MDIFKDLYKNSYDPYNASTYTTPDKDKPLTIDVILEAIDKIKPLPSFPEILYSKVLQPDDIYEWNQTLISLTLPNPRKIIFVGIHAAFKLVQKGIEIKNFKEEDMKYEEIDLEVIHTTQDAFLLSDGDKEQWFPASLVKGDESKRWYDYQKGETLTFEIATWFLEQEGFI